MVLKILHFEAATTSQQAMISLIFQIILGNIMFAPSENE